MITKKFFLIVCTGWSLLNANPMITKEQYETFFKRTRREPPSKTFNLKNFPIRARKPKQLDTACTIGDYKCDGPVCMRKYHMLQWKKYYDTLSNRQFSLLSETKPEKATSFVKALGKETNAHVATLDCEQLATIERKKDLWGMVSMVENFFASNIAQAKRENKVALLHVAHLEAINDLGSIGVVRGCMDRNHEDSQVFLVASTDMISDYLEPDFNRRVELHSINDANEATHLNTRDDIERSMYKTPKINTAILSANTLILAAAAVGLCVGAYYCVAMVQARLAQGKKKIQK